MGDINQVTISGHLGGNPEINEINGKKHAHASLAVSTFHTIRGKESFWLPIKCWGYNAEKMEKDCKKGDSLVVQGEIRVESYKDREGKDRTSTYVLVYEFKTCKKKEDFENER